MLYLLLLEICLYFVDFVEGRQEKLNHNDTDVDVRKLTGGTDASEHFDAGYDVFLLLSVATSIFVVQSFLHSILYAYPYARSVHQSNFMSIIFQKCGCKLSHLLSSNTHNPGYQPRVKPVASSFVMTDFERWKSPNIHRQQDLGGHLSSIFAAQQIHQKGPNEKAITQEGVEALFKRYGLSKEYINKRQVISIDPTDGSFSLWKETNGKRTLLSLGERMELYREYILIVMKDWYAGIRSAPADIVHVTCSGYTSPSAPQILVNEKGWSTRVTNAYHMGCYAAFPALRVAAGLKAVQGLTKRKGRVDVLHTEYLSVHMNPAKADPGNVIMSTLFGDGFIKYSLFEEAEFATQKNRKCGLKILGTHETMVPNSLKEMTWVPGKNQFDMYLDRSVPALIGKTISQFTSQLCDSAEIDFAKEKDELLFAVHPAGPALLSVIQKKLGIAGDQMELSRKVMKENGNMSSGTVIHILEEIIQDDKIPVGSKILAMAFGPGLTATGAVLEKI